MNKVKQYIVVGLLLAPVAVWAQEDWEKPAGGIEDARVVIEKDKVINLRPVSRRFKVIQFAAPEVKPLKVNFQLQDVADSLPPLQVIVRPKTMKDLPIEKLYGLNARLGYGNYASPYVLLDAGTKRNDTYALNGYFNHVSSGKGPVIGDFSAAGITRVGGAAKYFLNNLTLTTGADYRYQTYTIYGYNPEVIDTLVFDHSLLKQRLNVLALDIGLVENNVKNNTDHKVTLGVNYLINNHEISEFYYGLAYDFGFRPDKQWTFDVQAEYTGFNQNGVTISNFSRRLAQLRPTAAYRWNKFTFTAGVNAFYNYETNLLSSNPKEFYFYPVATVKYAISSHHEVEAGIDGAIEKLTLNGLYAENPYLSETVRVTNNINNFSMMAALQGQFSGKIGYRVNFQYRHYNRLLFYNNNSLDTARFDVVYDNGGASISRLAGELSYYIQDNINISANVAYNAYTTVDLAEAWQRPVVEAGATADFIILDKLTGHLSYFLLSGIKAQTAAGEVKTLAAIHDLNVGLNLSLTEKAGIFVDVMNIFGNNYQLYNNYPVKGFQVIGGVSYKF